MSAPSVWSPQRLQEALAEFRAETSKHGAPHRVAGRLSARWGVPLTAASVERALFRTGLGAWGQYVGQSTPVSTGRDIEEEPRTEPSHRLTVPPESEPVYRACTPSLSGPPRNGERILVLPDIHCPYHDEKAWRLVLAAAKVLRPSVLVIIGDLIDCYSVSSFPKNPERRQQLKWEIDETEKLLRQIDGLAPRTIYCEGNHEFRLEKYLCQRAPELYGMITIKDKLRIRERGWEWVPYKQWIKVGKTAFTHELGHCGKYAMPQSLDAFGGCVVIGHTHRGGTWYDGTVEGDHRFCMNVGWLGDPNQVDYMHRAKMRGWQQGIGVVDQDEHGWSWAQFIPIVNGRMMVGGERIAA